MLEKLIKLFFLYLPFQIALNPASGVDLASARIIILLLFLFWLVQSLKDKKIILANNLSFLLLLSFLFLSSFSLFFAQNLNWGLRKLIFFISIFPLYLIIYPLFSLNNLKKISLLKYVVWGGALSAILGIFQFLLQFIFSLNKTYTLWATLIKPFLGNSFSEAVLTNPSWLVNVGGHTLLRATAFFPDPHMFSFYLSLTGLISLGIFFYNYNTNKNPKKYNYLIIFILIALANILTFSRGGYLGLLAGLLFFSIFFFKNNLKNLFSTTKSIIITIFISILFLFILIIPNPFTSRLYSSFNLSEGSNSSRIETWKQSLGVINKKPLTGTGLGNYSLAIKPSAAYREPIYSHNTFLDIAAETGIFNAVIWFFVFLLSTVSLVRNFLFQNNIINLSLAASLMAFSVHSLFETAIFSVHILPLVILILALSSFKKNNA